MTVVIRAEFTIWAQMVNSARITIKTKIMIFFQFPNLPDFDNNFDYSKLETSPLKLKGYIFWFNDILDSDDGEDEDERKLALDTLKEKIIEMKQELGITQPIQQLYF